MSIRFRAHIVSLFRRHIRALTGAKRSFHFAEVYRFLHQGDVVGYNKRIQKTRRRMLNSQGHFNAAVRKALSTRARIRWDGLTACVVHYKPVDEQTMVIALGKPSSDDSFVAEQQRKDKQKRPTEALQRFNQLEAKLLDKKNYVQTGLVAYQKLKQEMATLRGSMADDPYLTGVDFLSTTDRHILEQYRAKSRQAATLRMLVQRAEIQVGRIKDKIEVLVVKERLYGGY
jgi:hypothetical protein